MPYASINPYTSELVKSFPDATDAEVAGAIDQAQAAFQTWKHTSFAVRATVMRAAAELLRRCLLYTSPSPRDRQKSRMPSSA